jgi:hypothetical protein
MRLIQTPTEVLLVLTGRNMPEMFRKSLNLELQGELVVSFRKPYRYSNIKASAEHLYHS